jgi:hypothetical protein
MRNAFAMFGKKHVFAGGIDWHLDMLSDKQLDATSFYQTITLPQNGSDVKVPWELSRFNVTWTLGKAYWTTSRVAYKEKFITLVSDWIEKNPFCTGVNWMSAMDVAIRAANWIAGFYFFNDGRKDFGDGRKTETETAFWITFLKSLWQHGIYLDHNLEYTRRSGNHLLADAVGLLTLGAFFKSSEIGRRWMALGKKILEEEILLQNYSDGVNYEMSVSYHRMVTEFFLTAFLLMKINNNPFSDAYANRLALMLRYVMYYTKPDGTSPLLGDADDGRLFWFRDDEDFNNHTSLAPFAHVLFDVPSPDAAFSEQALWLMGVDGWETFQRKKAAEPPIDLSSTLFAESQLAVMRDKDTHIFIDAAELGKHGWGGHGNNDTLSFELVAGGVNWLTDRGTFCYTANKELRNEFRSTRSHNTVMIDSTELAEFANAFKVKEDFTNPKVIKWETTPEHDTLIAEHYAYSRLPNPVVHRREFMFDKSRRELVITDTLTGSGEHTAEIFFHFAPDITLTKNGNRIIATHTGSAQLTLTVENESAEITLAPSWIAPRYNRRVETERITVRTPFTGSLVSRVRFAWQ